MFLTTSILLEYSTQIFELLYFVYIYALVLDCAVLFRDHIRFMAIDFEVVTVSSFCDYCEHVIGFALLLGDEQ